MNLPYEINSICFTGHRELSQTEEKLINQKLTHLLRLLIINRNLRICNSGGAIGFDTVASLSVLNLKKDIPDVKLHLFIPCQGQQLMWSDTQKELYNEIKQKADNVRVLSPFFYNGCMQARNREMLLCSDLCIAYLRAGTSGGGSLNTVIQATKMGIPVINLADPESEYLNEISK